MSDSDRQRFTELEAKITEELAGMRVAMSQMGMPEADIDAAVQRLFTHVGNGGSMDPETLGAILREYVPTVEEVMEREGANE